VRQQVEGRGRRDGHALHAVSAHALGQAQHVDAAQQDARGPADEARHRPEDLQVQDRQWQHHALPGRRLDAALQQRVDPGQEHVVLAVHRALGGTGRPAGVGDRGRGVRVDHDVRAGVRRGRDPAAPPLVQAQGARAGQVGRAGLGEQQRGTAVGQHELALRWGQRAVDTDPDRTDAHGGQERDDDVRRVRQAGRDPVAGPHALLPEHVRHPVRRDVQLAVGQLGGVVDDREPGRIGLEDHVQYGRDRARPRRRRLGDPADQTVLVQRGQRLGHGVDPASAVTTRTTPGRSGLPFAVRGSASTRTIRRGIS
jgi:hypothetical protein